MLLIQSAISLSLQTDSILEYHNRLKAIFGIYKYLL